MSEPLASLRRAVVSGGRGISASAGVFVRDVGRGLLEISHNSLAFVGLAVVAVALFVSGRDDLRQAVESEARGWLQARHEARLLAEMPAEPEPDLSEPTAVERATAFDPAQLDKRQSVVAQWLSRRYRVAPEPISRLVVEAWRVGELTKVDPTLILAVMAVESSFNPFAQSPVGAQGLMQVMTKVHDDKYESFGGRHAAFDPVTNLRVGVLVLKECIARAGSIEAGLRHYVGAAHLDDDGGYALKVLQQQNQLRVLLGLAPLPLPAVRPPTPPTQVAHDEADRPAPELTPVSAPAGPPSPSPPGPPPAEPVPAAGADKVALAS